MLAKVRMSASSPDSESFPTKPAALDCWYLTGATAGGKTTIGIELAQRINAEIISLDSMAIYRGMTIGTAKPSAEQQAAVPHHLLDIRDPDEEFSVSEYVDAAHQKITEISQRGKQVLFVGGTSLYLKALLRGVYQGPPADWEFRKTIEEEVERVGIEALHDRLRQVDPILAAKLHPHDQRRIIRALEVQRVTGEPLSHQQLQFEDSWPAERCRVFVIHWPRSILHKRIEERVERMFAAGLLEEVRGLLSQYGRLSRTATQAVGYREVLEYLGVPITPPGGKTMASLEPSDPQATAATPGFANSPTAGLPQGTLQQVIDRVKARTRQFARRQETWYRSLSECRWYERTLEDKPHEIAKTIQQLGQQTDAS